MSSFFKGMALFVATCCLVWVGVLWHWRSTQHDMSMQEVVLYLGLLPLVLFVLMLLARWAWRGATASAAAAAVTAPAAAAHVQPAAPDDAARYSTWQLLCAHGATVLGTQPEDWAAAAEAHAPTPQIDGELRNADGMPVICARVEGVDTEALQDELEPLLSSAQARHPKCAMSETMLRALALLREPLAAALGGLAPWATLLAEAPDGPQSARVRVLCAWPAGSNALEIEVSTAWLVLQLSQGGQGLVAPQRWAVVPTAAAALSGPELWLQADALFEAMRREERQDLLLLLAAHSDVNADAVERLEAAGRLFGSAQPKGVIPGEAAAALLLAPADWPADPQQEQVPAHLHRAAVGMRDKPVDGTGRVSHELPQRLVQQALQAARLPSDQVAMIANDANQNTPRGAELFSAMLAELPHLDASADVRMVGHLCGSTGACGTLLSAALAAHCARKAAQPCLALSVGHAQWRAALVARPAAPPETPAVPQASSSVSAAKSAA